MGWMKVLLLGEIGGQLNLQEHQRKMRRNRRADTSKKRKTDQDQDKRLNSLEVENDNLRLALAIVVRSLRKKGNLSHEQVDHLVSLLDTELKAPATDLPK